MSHANIDRRTEVRLASSSSRARRLFLSQVFHNYTRRVAKVCPAQGIVTPFTSPSRSCAGKCRLWRREPADKARKPESDGVDGAVGKMSGSRAVSCPGSLKAWKPPWQSTPSQLSSPRSSSLLSWRSQSVGKRRAIRRARYPAPGENLTLGSLRPSALGVAANRGRRLLTSLHHWRTLPQSSFWRSNATPERSSCPPPLALSQPTPSPQETSR